jgi:steroid 5-alpha reductase family enzyme
MKRDYSKWYSVALIAAIYTLAGAAGWLMFNALTSNPLTTDPLIALLCADVLATVVVWAFGLLYENVSVYDPYWSVFPPVAFLLWAFYTGVWSLPVCLLLIATCYWGWRLTRNWMITFKGIGHEDWRYTKYRSQHPLVFHTINLFGLNMMPTLIVFAAMLPGLKLFERPFDMNTLFVNDGHLFTTILLCLAFLTCLVAPTIQLIADKQSHDFRAANPGKVCNVGLWKHGRHPNYFGEILFWWGIWMMYSAFNGFDWYICGAIAMTALFLGISIPLMEQRQLANKPGYAEYRKQTRMFI